MVAADRFKTPYRNKTRGSQNNFQDKLIVKMKLSCFFIASACAQGDLFADDMLKSDFYGPISDEYQVKVPKPNDAQCCSTLKVNISPYFHASFTPISHHFPPDPNGLTDL